MEDDQSDDAILLSPTKKGAKRPSPFDDDEIRRTVPLRKDGHGRGHERDAKRHKGEEANAAGKQEDAREEVGQPNDSSNTTSAVDGSFDEARERSHDAPARSRTPTPKTSPLKRAYSVPPGSSPNKLRTVDLSEPLQSSPSKRKKQFRFQSVPLITEAKEEHSPVDVGESVYGPGPSTDVPVGDGENGGNESQQGSSTIANTTHVSHPPKSPSSLPFRKPSSGFRVPGPYKTPGKIIRNMFELPLSPLTPLPPTPFVKSLAVPGSARHENTLRPSKKIPPSRLALAAPNEDEEEEGMSGSDVIQPRTMTTNDLPPPIASSSKIVDLPSTDVPEPPTSPTLHMNPESRIPPRRPADIESAPVQPNGPAPQKVKSKGRLRPPIHRREPSTRATKSIYSASMRNGKGKGVADPVATSSKAKDQPNEVEDSTKTTSSQEGTSKPKLPAFTFSFAAPTTSSVAKVKPSFGSSSPVKSSPMKRPVSMFIPKSSSPTKPSSIPARPNFTRATTAAPTFRSTAHSDPPPPRAQLSILNKTLDRLNDLPPERSSDSLLPSSDNNGGGAPAAGAGRPSLGHKRASSLSRIEPKHNTSALGRALSEKPRSAAVMLKTKLVGSDAAAGPSIPGPSRAAQMRFSSVGPPSTPAAHRVGQRQKTLFGGLAASGASGSRMRGGMFMNGGAAANRFGRTRVSRDPGLETVEGSPVKGGESTMRQEPSSLPDDDDSSSQLPQISITLEDILGPPTNKTPSPSISQDKGKGRETDSPLSASGGDMPPPSIPRAKPDSRRMSMASHLLSQSIITANATPPTPKTNTVTALRSGPAPTRTGLRSSTHSASPNGAPGRANGYSNAGNKGGKESRKVAKVLKDCTIFVDVRTDDGDDAGNLFVDMLRNLGARILGRPGQTCTHIVFKNGLTSTLTRYRLLHDPKPLIVGIAWVVECVEKQTKVEESKFIIDLDFVDTSNSKRRRSVLSKISDLDSLRAEAGEEHAVASDVDVSFESTSSLANDGDGKNDPFESLPPLERARRRKQLMMR